MADPQDDQDDDIYDEGEVHDDGTSEVIRKALEAATADETDDDEGGFDQPLNPEKGEEPDVVSPEDGRELLDDAEQAALRGKKAEDEAETPKDKAASDTKAEDAAPEDTKTEDAAQTEDTPPDLTSADMSALLDGVPDDRRAEISRRVGDAQRVMSAFDSHKAELDMHGTTPEAALNRLLELNTFAQKNTHEYSAWVAGQIGGDPSKVLSEAAKLHGMKLVQDDDDDDLFDDPEIARLKAENAQLRAQQQGNTPTFGPDTPERRQERDSQQALNAWVNETDDAGQLKRPFYGQLLPQIRDMANQHVAQTQKPVTPDDLQRFYDAAFTQAQSMFQPQPAPQANPAPQPTSAAQATPSVADQVSAKAAAARKAQRASKSLDGTGQGASRRPALSDDASLMDTLNYFANQGGG